MIHSVRPPVRCNAERWTARLRNESAAIFSSNGSPRLDRLARVAMSCSLLWPVAPALAQAPTPTDAAASAPLLQLPRVVVPGRRPIDIGPMPGLAVTPEQIPSNLQSATKEQIKESRALNVGDYMNTQLQGVSVNDYSGNPFRMDVNYRGFSASPQVGTPQGVSVFFDGIRVNEPFGDVVNWDLIPLNAIDRFDLFPGSNPLFGLNTLGGALSLRTKSGFTAPGIEASVLAGSFRRRQLQLSGGANNGTFAGFGALHVFDEDGWRDDSPSRVRQFFGRGDWNLGRAVLTASVLAADNKLIGNGLVPTSLVEQRPEAVFTSPDSTGNQLAQLALSAIVDVSDTQNITASVYRRKSDRDGVGGDIYEGFDDFSGPNADIGDFVDIDGRRITRNGAKQFNLVGGMVGAPGFVEGTPIGLLTSTALKQTTDGLALQYNWNLPQHKLMVGASIDRSKASYLMTQRLGLIDAAHRVYADPDNIDANYIAARRDIIGNDFSGTSTTKSLYFSETWSPRTNLHFTGAARYNDTDVDTDLFIRASSVDRDLHELRGTTQGLEELINRQTLTEEKFNYRSFNPSLGVNWLPFPELNLYGNVSRGARVPSVVELGCAFDATPVNVSITDNVDSVVPRSLLGANCSLPTTLSGDPFLPQIRAKSGEIGARGRLAGNWQWNASLFRTDLKDDIYFVGVGDGKSYFDTVGKTRRQGLELGLAGSVGRLDLRVSYSYVDATFQSTFYTLSPHNSSADFDQNSQASTNRPELVGIETLPSPTAGANGGRGTYRMIRIDPESRLPGIPEHALNANLAWRASDALRLGLGVVIRSDSFVRGNENNQHRPGGTDQESGIYYCAGGCFANQGGLVQQPVRPGRPFGNSGRLPGYAIFNLDAAYRVSSKVEVFVQIANLFDRKYYTAGRLGVNPFSRPANGVGAIGPSGWNYNSAEWQNTTFVGPGAPRGIWVGVNVELDAEEAQ